MARNGKEPDPGCRICDGTGWKEVPSGDGGWALDNVPCNCITTDGQDRKPGKHRRSFFSAISHILDDCYASGVMVYCVKMHSAKRDYLIRQMAGARKRPTLPGREAHICGVPIVADDNMRPPFLVITDENQHGDMHMRKRYA